MLLPRQFGRRFPAAAVAGVWLYHGLWCKLLGRCPEQVRIVADVPGLRGRGAKAVLLMIEGVLDLPVASRALGRRSCAAAAVVVLASACGAGSMAPPLAGDRDVKLLRAPEGGEYDLPVWLPAARRLVVAFSPPGRTDDAAYDALYSLRLDGSGRTRLRLPARRGCKFTAADVPVRLPDGRLGYSERCWGGYAPRRAVRLRAYDTRTGRTSLLRPYALPFSWSFVAIAPGGRAVANDGRSLEEHLWRLGPTRATRMPVSFDRVGYPRWSPAGRLLALDAVPAGMAGESTERLNARRNLYLLDGRGSVVRLLVRGATQVGPAAWSPDGRRVALAMKPRGQPYGLYLVDARSGRQRLVIERGQLGGVTWISGRELVAAVGVFSHVEGVGGDVGLYRIHLRGR